MRGGVPVFRRPTSKGSSRRRAARPTEAGIAGAAAGVVGRGPRGCGRARKVPTVSTTARAVKRRPDWVMTPVTRSPSTIRSSTPCWNSCRLGCASSSARTACRYSAPVGLGAGGADGRALAGVQGAEVDAGPVGGRGHDAAQRIDLPGEVALADAADGRVAAHLADGFEVLGEQQGAGAQARGGRGGFGAGVAAADHDHVKGVVAAHIGRHSSAAADRSAPGRRRDALWQGISPEARHGLAGASVPASRSIRTEGRHRTRGRDLTANNKKNKKSHPACTSSRPHCRPMPAIAPTARTASGRGLERRAAALYAVWAVIAGLPTRPARCPCPPAAGWSSARAAH